jgi:hypothetical protein
VKATDIGQPTTAVPIAEAAKTAIPRCQSRSMCDGVVLRLAASIEAGACCCCRGDHTDHDLHLLEVGPS